ncbi:glycosyltransferase family 1 protein [Brachyspira sp.]|uniref:glycosyltransferase family 4 protein n=1 Tax=Brachyspira sp. TaxID=1977261 RepID=UPI00261ABF05|nr:glycosyltransferase family 1 protein [Brachyspira sp.]
MKLLKLLYNKEEKGIYCIRTILGIRITTKPYSLKMQEKIRRLEELVSLNLVSNLDIYKNYKDNLLSKKYKSNLPCSNNIRILFDFRTYEYTYDRGIGRYIFNLVNHILKNYPEIDVSIIKNSEKNDPIFDYNHDKVKFYYYDKINKLFEYNFQYRFDFLFLDDILLIHNKLDNIHKILNNVYNNVVMENVDNIVGISHDLIPTVFLNNFFDEIPIYYYHYFFILNNLKYFTHFFANSESTKNDLIKYANIESDKITNIYGGVATKFNNLKIHEYSFSKRLNHIVYISDITAKKNSKGLIRAFAIAYNNNKIPKDSKLYLCYKLNKESRQELLDEMEKVNISEKQIIITGFISDEKLIEIISKAKASFMTSFYEGLGMPILESYACNTPSFASNVSSTKEIVLEECSFNPYDDNDIANSIVKAFNDEELCKKSLEFGKKLLKTQCNWDIISEKVVNKLYKLKNNNINIR